MLVLRSVIDQQQKPSGGHALDQAIEQRLGLRVDPVQVFEDQQQRLNLTFSQEKAFDRFKGASAPLRLGRVLPTRRHRPRRPAESTRRQRGL